MEENNTLVSLNAKVLFDFYQKVRRHAVDSHANLSEYIRDLVARDLGFSSYVEYLHIGKEINENTSKESSKAA
jgi:hypothetical protein